jgi:hypothetical protein
MSDILDLLGQKLDARTIQTLAGQIGAAPRQTQAAVETALPLLLGALQRNVAAPQGAASLLGALDRDHDGSVLENVAGFFGQAATGADLRSVEHIFGGRQGGVQSAVARASGLDSGQVMQLLAQLAPLLLGLLGRARRTTGADAGGLGDLLGGAMGRMQQSNPGLGGLLGGLLDADGDGSAVDDLLGKAMGGGAGGGLGDLLGGLLGGKR